MNEKKYTQEQLDHAIDHALKIGDQKLAYLEGAADRLESVIGTLTEELKTVRSVIDTIEKERYNDVIWDKISEDD